MFINTYICIYRFDFSWINNISLKVILLTTHDYTNTFHIAFQYLSIYYVIQRSVLIYICFFFQLSADYSRELKGSFLIKYFCYYWKLINNISWGVSLIFKYIYHRAQNATSIIHQQPSFTSGNWKLQWNSRDIKLTMLTRLKIAHLPPSSLFARCCRMYLKYICSRSRKTAAKRIPIISSRNALKNCSNASGSLLFCTSLPGLHVPVIQYLLKRSKSPKIDDTA